MLKNSMLRNNTFKINKEEVKQEVKELKLPNVFYEDIKNQAQYIIDNSMHLPHNRCHPSFTNFITEVDGVKIINVAHILNLLEVAIKKIQKIIASGKKLLFVCTKSSVSDVVKVAAETSKQFWATKWKGGILTNMEYNVSGALKNIEALREKIQDKENYHKKDINSFTSLLKKREADTAGFILEDSDMSKAKLGGVIIIDADRADIARAEVLKAREYTNGSDLNTNNYSLIVLGDGYGKFNLHSLDAERDCFVPINDDTKSSVEYAMKLFVEAINIASTGYSPTPTAEKILEKTLENQLNVRAK